MKLHNAISATDFSAPKTGTAALATAHYSLFRLSRWAAGKLYKKDHFA
jgi:hypothetical protein